MKTLLMTAAIAAATLIAAPASAQDAMHNGGAMGDTMHKGGAIHVAETPHGDMHKDNMRHDRRMMRHHHRMMHRHHRHHRHHGEHQM